MTKLLAGARVRKKYRKEPIPPPETRKELCQTVGERRTAHSTHVFRFRRVDRDDRRIRFGGSLATSTLGWDVVHDLIRNNVKPNKLQNA